MPKKRRSGHLRVVEKTPEAAAEFEQLQIENLTLINSDAQLDLKRAPVSELPYVQDDLEALQQLVIEFRFAQKVMPMQLAGRELLEPAWVQFSEGLTLLAIYEEALNYWQTLKLTTAQKKHLDRARKVLLETRALLTGALADLEKDMAARPASMKKGNKGKAARGRSKGAKGGRGQSLSTCYQMKVSLKGAKPPIWRRVIVPAHYSLETMHRFLQFTMGWRDCHLHQFEIGRKFYTVVDENNPHALNEEDYTLFDFNLRKRSKFLYEYDFGDGWLHEIVVEEVIEDSMEDAEIDAG